MFVIGADAKKFNVCSRRVEASAPHREGNVYASLFLLQFLSLLMFAFALLTRAYAPHARVYKHCLLKRYAPHSRVYNPPP